MSMIPVSNGRVAGARTLIQGGLSIAVTDLIRPVTSANALIFAAASNRGARRVFHSVLDAQDRLSEWTELKTPIGRGAMPTFPVMSPDGARFAYRFGSLGGPPVPGRGAGVRVQNMTTGEDKVLFMSDGPIFNCVWSSMLYCGQPLTAEGKTAILSIDTTTGRSETLASFPGIRTTDSVSNDGRYLVMFGLSGPTAFSRWEIGTPQEGPGLPNGSYPSADGRWAFRAGPDSNNRWEFQIRPATAAEDAWEHLTYHRKQAADARDVVALKFTADGNWIVYHDVDTNGKDALFRLRATGGEPQRLGDYPTSSPNSFLSVSADGRHFLVETSPINPTSAEGLQTDYWILQNFLPNAVTAAPKN